MDITTLLTILDKHSVLFYVVLAIYVAEQLTPLILHKVRSAKVEHLEKRGSMILAKAKHIVVPIANEVGLSNSDRREKAVSMLYKFLVDHGIKVNRNDLYAVVETAYRYMKSNGYLDDKKPQETGNPEDLSDEELDALTPDINK